MPWSQLAALGAGVPPEQLHTRQASLHFDQPILVEPMLLALPTDHPLANDAATPLPLAALAIEAFVLYRRRVGLGLYDAILVACREAGFSPQVVQEAPRMTATLSLVAAGLLVWRRQFTSRLRQVQALELHALLHLQVDGSFAKSGIIWMAS